ncbi:MAG: YkgJ family cysteine cluster protein [Sedimentisphaerales bacterium]
MAKNIWYIGGLHFECAACGNCCSGPDEGVIWISKPEIKLLAEHLGLSDSELRKKYLRRIGFHISILENPQTKDCVFLRHINGSKKCTIYNFRPMQCRTWPFWTVNIDSPDDWNRAAMKCPGINKGKFYSFDEIEKIKNLL